MTVGAHFYEYAWPVGWTVPGASHTALMVLVMLCCNNICVGIKVFEFVKEETKRRENDQRENRDRKQSMQPKTESMCLILAQVSQKQIVNSWRRQGYWRAGLTWYSVLLVVVSVGNCTDWKRGFGIPWLRFFVILAKVVDFLILFQVSVGGK